MLAVVHFPTTCCLSTCSRWSRAASWFAHGCGRVLPRVHLLQFSPRSDLDLGFFPCAVWLDPLSRNCLRTHLPRKGRRGALTCSPFCSWLSLHRFGNACTSPFASQQKDMFCAVTWPGEQWQASSEGYMVLYVAAWLAAISYRVMIILIQSCCGDAGFRVGLG